MVLQGHRELDYLVVAVALLSCPLSTLAQSIIPGQGHELKVLMPDTCDYGLALNGLHTGTIHSHEGDTKYAPGRDCTLIFTVRPKHVMRFEFEHFELQNRVRGECQDYVQFHAGDFGEKALTEPLCGKVVPAAVYSNASRIELTFRTNERVESSGFRMRFRRTRDQFREMQCQRSSEDCHNAESEAETEGLRALRNSTVPVRAVRFTVGMVVTVAFLCVYTMWKGG